MWTNLTGKKEIGKLGDLAFSMSFITSLPALLRSGPTFLSLSFGVSLLIEVLLTALHIPH